MCMTETLLERRVNFGPKEWIFLIGQLVVLVAATSVAFYQLNVVVNATATHATAISRNHDRLTAIEATRFTQTDGTEMAATIASQISDLEKTAIRVMTSLEGVRLELRMFREEWKTQSKE